jgi:hypothetical protein
MKIARLSAISTGRLYRPGKIAGAYLCQRQSRPQDHSAAERITSMKNFKVSTVNQNRHIQALTPPTALVLLAVLPVGYRFESRQKRDRFLLNMASALAVATIEVL